MRAVLTRVKYASVEIDGKISRKIGKGFLILLGIGPDDTPALCTKLAEKVLGLRVFRDENDKMNLSVNDVGGAVMVVPNFTLLASYKKGNRPAFVFGADPQRAEELFDYFSDYIKDLVPGTAKGKFRSHMEVELVNDGPVTIPLDSRVLRGERSI